MYKKRTAVINYGMGNIGSIANALEFLDGNFFITSNKRELKDCDAVILPGVGAFAAAMEKIESLDLQAALESEVLIQRKPFLGICLGMHLLASDSVEGGLHKGLGWIGGHVLNLGSTTTLRVPHVGWNNVDFNAESTLFKSIDGDAHFYFDHSYHFKSEINLNISTYTYGKTYIAAFEQDHIFATQFHPEKSQRNGLKRLRNYLNYVESV